VNSLTRFSCEPREDDSPPERKEDVSPASRNMDAVCKVFTLEIGCKHECELYYLWWMGVY
jgi:hypothetical protein